MTRRLPWLAIPLFIGCPLEFHCVSVDPRPTPVTLAEANDALVDGLVRCGYVVDGRRGSISVVRIDGSAQLMPCLGACVRALQEDCEALSRMACLNDVPKDLAECVRACDARQCGPEGAMAERPCSPTLRCGVAVDGLAVISDVETPSSFPCADGTGFLAESHVCDFVEDCPDGSDEASRLHCARLSCTEVEQESDTP